MSLPPDTLPHNLDAERAVLAAALFADADAGGHVVLEKLTAKLVVTDFFTGSHQTIFAAILGLIDAGHQVDALTVADALRQSGQFEEEAVRAAFAAIGDPLVAPIPAHVDDYIATVLREWGHREVRLVCLQVGQQSPNGQTPAAIATELGERLSKIAERAEPEAFQQSAQRTPAFLPIADVMEATHLTLRFSIADLVPCPVAYVNERFAGGFKRKELVLVGSGPGVGKSAFVAEWARYAAQRGHRVGIITIEMANQDFGERLLVQAGPISATAMRGRHLDDGDWTTIERVVPELSGLPIEFSDEVTHVQQIGRMLRRREDRHQEPFRLLFVDYLQLLDAPRAQARYQEVGLIAKLLKRYAKRHDLTMVALSSFTPGPPEKGKKRRRPTMQNLRESRDLDHHADGIVLLWKPQDDSSDRELIIDKGRGGQTGVTRLAFTGQYLSFQELT